MSIYCPSYSQNCYHDCCDYYGNCPIFASDCYNYYHNRITAGTIIGIVIGILFFITFIILIVYFCRRFRERNLAPLPPPPPQNPQYIVDPNNPYYLQRPQVTD
jgi:hypothetical protein